MGLARIVGVMADLIMGNGWIIKCMGLVFINSKMGDFILGDIGIIRRMDMEFIKLKAGRFMRGTGRMGELTGWEHFRKMR